MEKNVNFAGVFMKILNTDMQGLYIVQSDFFVDNRGEFIKNFQSDFLMQSGLDMEIKESYYTVSNKDVIRGMHFQVPPYEHTKVVYVSYGEILDVVLDIRKNSSTYGKYFSINLSHKNPKALFISSGFAHGFKSLCKGSIVNYMQSTCYNQKCDKGVYYNSFGFDWQCKTPIISERDMGFKNFDEFVTPFE